MSLDVDIDNGLHSYIYDCLAKQELNVWLAQQRESSGRTPEQLGQWCMLQLFDRQIKSSLSRKPISLVPSYTRILFCAVHIHLFF